MPVPAGLCPLKIGDWLLISLQFYLTGVFPALINPCHLHTFYDRVSIKHCNGNYSFDTAKAIVNSSARYVLSYFFSNNLCTEIVSKTDEEFLEYSKNSSSHVKISKNDIYDFHTKLCDFFTHLLSQI